jgi:alpha/beta superfamily hydrolase
MGTMIFFHGRESGPGGTKARWLAARYGAITPALDTSRLEVAVAQASDAVLAHAPTCVVGSSFGGAVAVSLLRSGVLQAPVVLIAPAAAKLGVHNALPTGSRVTVIHGDGDDVVPVSDSIALAATGGPGVRLEIISGGDHRLNRILEDGVLEQAIAPYWPR